MLRMLRRHPMVHTAGVLVDAIRYIAVVVAVLLVLEQAMKLAF
jgi:hypothetical protein